MTVAVASRCLSARSLIGTSGSHAVPGTSAKLLNQIFDTAANLSAAPDPH
jgi:hypothetical protein